ncbi:transposase [Paenibacillus larvae]|nr:transposase [Paenibacillus larvae]MDT2240590.1 transposase [Paenibacillus larvae]
MQEDEQYTAETFLSFLQKVMATYPTGKLALVLDNARIHHAKLLRPFPKLSSACRAILWMKS